MAELPEERYTRELLERLFGVTLRKIPECSTPTPDYELLHDGACLAVLEVRRMEYAPLADKPGTTIDETGFAVRRDNGLDRVATAIYEKWKQLSTRTEPKILVFVNDEHFLDALDLENVFNGGLFYGTPGGSPAFGDPNGFGYFNTAATRLAACQRIADLKGRIDVYVWIDRIPGEHRHPHEPQFRFTGDVGYQLGRRFFGTPELPPRT